MANSVGLDKFALEIEKILEEYQDQIDEGIADAVEAVTKAGVKAVKAAARSNFKKGKGQYSSGWTSKVEKGRLETTGFIYNGKVPGLPHLLEHGHAGRNGTRVGATEGREHIKQVEEMVNKEFEQKVVRSI
jgi:hypothetical protein